MCMEPALKNLVQKLSDLDKRAEELAKVLQDVRIEINNMLWDFLELKKGKHLKLKCLDNHFACSRKLIAQ